MSDLKNLPLSAETVHRLTIDLLSDLGPHLGRPDTWTVASGVTLNSIGAVTAATSNGHAAKIYASLGWKVLPWRIDEHGKKVPVTKDTAIKQATTDEQLIDAWWKKYPKAGVAVACGHGNVIIDIDGPEGLATLIEKIGPGVLPRGPRVKSGNGWHLYYQAPAEVLPTVMKQKVELRAGPGDTHYCCAPPSLHPNKQHYTWFDADLPLPPFPADAFAWLLVDRKPSAMTTALDDSDQRNIDLASLLGALRAKGVGEEAIRAFAVEQNQQFTNGPLPPRELEATIRSILRYAPGDSTARRAAPTATPTIRSYVEIEEKPVRWAWPRVLPSGHLSTWVGEPGNGKSIGSLDLAARFTRGDTMPDGTPNGFGEPVNVLILAVEDNPEDTIKPRLRAAGADMPRVFDVRFAIAGSEDAERLPTFPDDVPALAGLIREHSIRLVIVDPITAFLSERLDSWKDADVRRALTPLTRLAQDVDAVVLGIMHVNKDEAKSLINRVSSSKAFTAVPRGVWFVAVDPDATHQRLVVPIKTNLGPRDRSFAFSLTGFDEGAGRVRWEREALALDAEGFAERQRHASAGEKQEKRYTAALILIDMLTGKGWVPTDQVAEHALAKGVSSRWLRKVAKDLGVKVRKASFDGAWEWSWDESPRPDPRLY